MSAPQPGILRKQRLLVFSDGAGVARLDISGATTAAFTVPLRAPIAGVVFIELASTSQPGYAIQLDEARERGVFAHSAQPFWRFGSGAQMGRYPPFPERLHEPFTLHQLTVRTMSPDGTRAFLPPAIYELEVYSLVD